MRSGHFGCLHFGCFDFDLQLQDIVFVISKYFHYNFAYFENCCC
jgi:hypothetical protein